MPEITRQRLYQLHEAKDVDVLARMLRDLGIHVYAQKPRDPKQKIAVPCTRTGCRAVRIVWRQNADLVSLCDKHAAEHKRMLNRLRQRRHQQRKRLMMR